MLQSTLKATNIAIVKDFASHGARMAVHRDPQKERVKSYGSTHSGVKPPSRKPSRRVHERGENLPRETQHPSGKNQTHMVNSTPCARCAQAITDSQRKSDSYGNSRFLCNMVLRQKERDTATFGICRSNGDGGTAMMLGWGGSLSGSDSSATSALNSLAI